jgi:hypothetical protein
VSSQPGPSGSYTTDCSHADQTEYPPGSSNFSYSLSGDAQVWDYANPGYAEIGFRITPYSIPLADDKVQSDPAIGDEAVINDSSDACDAQQAPPPGQISPVNPCDADGAVQVGNVVVGILAGGATEQQAVDAVESALEQAARELGD